MNRLPGLVNAQFIAIQVPPARSGSEVNPAWDSALADNYATVADSK